MKYLLFLSLLFIACSAPWPLADPEEKTITILYKKHVPMMWNEWESTILYFKEGLQQPADF